MLEHCCTAVFPLTLYMGTSVLDGLLVLPAYLPEITPELLSVSHTQSRAGGSAAAGPA